MIILAIFWNYDKVHEKSDLQGLEIYIAGC